MTSADEPKKKPPPQPTAAWSPDDLPGVEKAGELAPDAGEDQVGPKQPQRTLQWSPDEVAELQDAGGGCCHDPQSS